ncbi:MAPEG family protein [uncultured Tateyamaria sp.]|uniref:MAPEG family protein n=1 Tax=uncultured Tateyamaria sp. TaxID=455651 RepID=UPI002603094F|nr:MAPEG family protein [uncultured Tateyamaria sp.]
MTIELWSVFVTGGMLWLSIVIQQLHLDKIGGTAYALSNRADPPPDSPAQGRLLRAVRNQSDVAAVWIALVVVQQVTGSSGTLTYWASLAMIVSRIFYLPLYAFGIIPFRSLSWALFLIAAPVFAVGVVLGLDAVGMVAGQ